MNACNFLFVIEILSHVTEGLRTIERREGIGLKSIYPIIKNGWNSAKRSRLVLTHIITIVIVFFAKVQNLYCITSHSTLNSLIDNSFYLQYKYIKKIFILILTF